MKSRCPQGLRCHLPIFLLVIFIFFILQTNSSDGLMVRSKRPYSNGIITCRASLYFIHSFLSLDSGLQFNIPIALQTIFQICLKCQRSCPDPPPWELRAVSLCDLLPEDKNGVELDSFWSSVFSICLSHGPVVLSLDGSAAQGTSGNGWVRSGTAGIWQVSPVMLLNILPCMGQLSANNFCCLIAKSCRTFFQPLWTVACQALLSMGFSRHEYWSGLPFPSRGYHPNSGIEPASLKSPALAYGFFFFFFFFTTKPPGKPQQRITWPQKCRSWAILNQTVTPKGSCYLKHCVPRLVLGTQQRLNKCWLNQ